MPNVIRFGPELQAVCQQMTTHFRYSHTSDARWFRTIRDYGRSNGVLTREQVRLLGCIYKRNLQGDDYVHHNWPWW